LEKKGEERSGGGEREGEERHTYFEDENWR